jgi:glycosyltransferase involved in cell wall biosynthesis
VTETYPPDVNGVASTLSHLVRGLQARGHGVTVVRPDPHAPGWTGGAGDPAVIAVRSAPVPGYAGVRVGWPSRAILQRCWAAHRPDAVYVATEGPLGWSAVRVADRLGIPAFSGFHTNFHDYARHYRAGWLRPVIRHYLRRFHNRTRGTFVASPALRDELRAAGYRNVSVLGRGVDTALFTPARRSRALRSAWGASDRDLVAIHVGRVAAEKNIGLAIQAYRAMREAAGVRQLVVVGDGPARAGLEQAHGDLLFAGLRAGADLAAHYASADVFLFPSETETFGNVTLEAMASGLAVVAYAHAGARMHIADGETGVLVPYRDAPAFVARAAALARARARLPELRRRARAHAVTADWQSIVERFLMLLSGGREEVQGAGS